ncbi:MAG TPA: phage tail sheath subtilisin-like domain-containing protein [Micropepsaceae bacterium]
MANYFTPEVYIEEFEPAAPIAGVGTSTAAFLGPCAQGPLNQPTRVNSWDEFVRTFGAAPVPNFYLWYAARGFYENGGTTAFITRVSNATYGEMTLNDISAAPTLIVRARQAGLLNPGFSITVDSNIHTVDAPARLFRPTATIAGAAVNTRIITLTSAADAERFRPGDRITWAGVAPADDRATIARVNGATLEILNPLSAGYGGGALRLANPAAGDDTLRVENGAAVAPGMVLSIKQAAPAAVANTMAVKSVTIERISGALTTHRVTFQSGLTAAYDFSGGQVDVQSQEFKLTVTPAVGTPIVYDGLGMDPAHPRYYDTIVNGVDPYIMLIPVDPVNTTPVPNNRPNTLPIAAMANGTADTPATLTSANYKSAIAQLEAIDDINIISIPDRVDPDVQTALVGHCEKMADRFAVLDAARNLPPFGTPSINTQRSGLTSSRGYAALYYPWLTVSDNTGNLTLNVPPSGHMAGIYARTDQLRGVHKAPAGTEAIVRGALGVERAITHTEQEGLNPNGINVVRVFSAGGRPIVWGARTTASGYGGDANWQYVNIRRLFLYLEESIQEGIRGAVFEPNNLALWQKLKRSIGDFLTRAWRDGALFGAKAEEAFYVRIDEVLNPFSEQQLGRLHIEIGVRPSYPAEFIIVRIGIWDGGSEVTEA